MKNFFFDVVLLVSFICCPSFLATGQINQKPELYIETGHNEWINRIVFSTDGKLLASASIDDTVKIWDAASGQELRTLTGHTVSASDAVESIAFSPDGKLLASGAKDNLLKIWDVSTGKEIITFKGHTSTIEALSFSPDGKFLASTDFRGTIKLWDLALNQLYKTFSLGDNSSADSIIFSKDGQKLLTASGDNVVVLDINSGKETQKIRTRFSIKGLSLSSDEKIVAVANDWYNFIEIFDVASGKSIGKLEGNKDSIQSIDFSPDGKKIVSGSGRKERLVKIWDVSSGKEILSLKGHTDDIRSVKFSPDGSRIASAGGGLIGGNDIKFWDANSGAEIKNLTEHTAETNKIAVSPDGTMLAIGSGDHMVQNTDKIIRLWSLTSGGILKTLTGHTTAVYSVAFSPDNKMLASGSGRGTVKLWDIASGQEIKSFEAHRGFVLSVAFSFDGKMLATAGSAGAREEVKIWDTASGEEIKSFSGHSNLVNAVAFSPDGKMLVSGSADHSTKVWDIASGKEILSFGDYAFFSVKTSAMSPDGKIVASGSLKETIKLWDAATGKELKTLTGHKRDVESIAFSPDGKTLISASGDEIVKLWDVASGQEIKTLKGKTKEKYQLINAVSFSPDGKLIATGSSALKLWDAKSGEEIKSIPVNGFYNIGSLAFSPDSKTIIAEKSKDIVLWDTATGDELKIFKGHTDNVRSLAFSSDGKMIVSGGEDNSLKLWDVSSGKEIKTFQENQLILSVAFSPDNKTVASSSKDGAIRFWSIESGKEIKAFGGETSSLHFSPDGKSILAIAGKGAVLWDIKSEKIIKDFAGFDGGAVKAVAFSKDGKIVFSENEKNLIKAVEIASGKELNVYQSNTPETLKTILAAAPDFYVRHQTQPITLDHKFQIRVTEDKKLILSDAGTNELAANLVAIDQDGWIVTTPDGRFDTNKSLDKIEGLHWIVNNEILKPLPVDVFMRQYYEPGLLHRVLTDEKFKPLPSIADINRIQPKVSIKEIKLAANSSDSADVTIEVESIAENIDLGAEGKTKKKILVSGAFDLRLFRDGQLIGVSTPKNKLEKFIADAPQLIAKTKSSGKLLDTPEDKAWRETNDIFKLKSENIRFISPTKAEYTFRSIKIPRDGRKEIEFTAYAFNADKVKSKTTEPFKFSVPKAIFDTSKKGRAFVVSIGVNASENPKYNLRYAANDARKMQEILGSRLKINADKYSEIVSVPLISDYDENKKPTENAAQKAVIKAVFTLLSGNAQEIKTIPVNVLKQIPDPDKITAVEPEDTLIITYAGHGYADNAGIFYLLPYDIGKEATKLTTKVLQKTISSDELSLWMQDITAAEMIMIIDACHSSAAVQGDGFKPGPMGSRGLGQLAYDKDMKILSATQANNVALELNSLEQGLLSYALLQDGIVDALADTDKNKQLFSDEWLSYAERRVPELYQEVKDGKRGIMIDGRNVKGEGMRSELAGAGITQENKSKLQQPSLFDFKRRSNKNNLFVLQ